MDPISTRILNCGMTLIVEPSSSVRSAGLTWLVPAGSACDPEERQGISAMWSELLLRGAGLLESRPQTDAFDRLGASRSTGTSVYFMRLGATMLGDQILDVLPLLSDMVLRPRFDQSAIDPARDLALQALESLADDPRERAAIAARLRHRPRPINRSGMGTAQGIKDLDRQQICDDWFERVRPQRSVLTVAGAVDPDAITSKLDQLLKGWEGTTPEIQPDMDAPRGYAHETDDTNQVQIILLHDAPAERDKDCVLESVVISVLSGGMAGRLFTEVREKRGLCYAVSAGYATARDYGGVFAYVGTTPERAQESLDVLVNELIRINGNQAQGGGITQDEFQRAIVGIKSSLIFSGESTSARAAALASDHNKIGYARSLAERTAQIDAVTFDQVNEYLAGRSLGTLTIQTLGPTALKAPAV